MMEKEAELTKVEGKPAVEPGKAVEMEGKPKAEPVAEKQETVPSAPEAGAEDKGLPVELSKLIDEKIEQVRAEYEGKGGHIGKLKSEYDKKLAEKDRRLRELEEANLKKIRELVQEDPAEAGAMALSQLEQLQAERQAEQARQSWNLFVRDGYEHYGFDMNDKEIAQQVSDEGEEIFELVRQGADPTSVALEFQKKVASLALERERKEKLNLKKELDSLPELVEQAVTQVLTARGAVPEIVEPEGGARPARKLGASELLRRGINQGRKDVPINKY